MRLFLASLILAAPAAAQQDPASRTFQPPAGCTAFLTVQSTACSVSHHFTCERDPEGWQRRVDMDGEGITYFGAVDRETQWVESFHVLSGSSETLAPNPADPASFDELTSTGQDSFDFVTNSAQFGPTRFVGSDRLTGETVTIDGVELDRTEYRITAYGPDGEEAWRGTGNEFISREWRMFLSGRSSILVDDQVEETDETPREFVFPDEPGFLATRPKYGCGELSSLDAPAMSAPKGEG